MSLSHTRRLGSAHSGDRVLPEEIDLGVYEVFIQKKRGLPHVHAGALHAPDTEHALRLAREHYGQDEACVHIWVTRRDQLGSTGYDDGPINKAIEHNYRYARDYQHIRGMWKAFRDEAGLQEYEQGDLKETF